VMICSKCKYEIEKGEPVYCYSCFNLLVEEIEKLQKENQRLKEENKQLKDKIELLKMEMEEKKWKRKKSPYRFHIRH